MAPMAKAKRKAGYFSKTMVSRGFSSTTRSRGLLLSTKGTMKRGGLPPHFQVSRYNSRKSWSSGASVGALPWKLPHPCELV